MLDGHTIDLPPARHMLVVRNDDRPGMIAFVAGVLADAGVNIDDMHLGRSPRWGPRCRCWPSTIRAGRGAGRHPRRRGHRVGARRRLTAAGGVRRRGLPDRPVRRRVPRRSPVVPPSWRRPSSSRPSWPGTSWRPPSSAGAFWRRPSRPGPSSPPPSCGSGRLRGGGLGGRLLRGCVGRGRRGVARRGGFVGGLGRSGGQRGALRRAAVRRACGGAGGGAGRRRGRFVRGRDTRRARTYGLDGTGDQDEQPDAAEVVEESAGHENEGNPAVPAEPGRGWPRQELRCRAGVLDRSTGRWGVRA